MTDTSKASLPSSGETRSPAESEYDLDAIISRGHPDNRSGKVYDETTRRHFSAAVREDDQVSALNAMKETEEADVEFLLSGLDQKLLDSIAAREFVRSFRKQIIQCAIDAQSQPAIAAPPAEQGK